VSYRLPQRDPDEAYKEHMNRMNMRRILPNTKVSRERNELIIHIVSFRASLQEKITPSINSNFYLSYDPFDRCFHTDQAKIRIIEYEVESFMPDKAKIRIN
jgi:hypothetical protein